VDKVVSSAILNEDFSSAAGGCCGTSGMPSGWSREASAPLGFLFGALFSGSVSPAAVHWDDSTDAWLFSTPLVLEPGITYQLEFKHQLSNGGGGTHDVNVYLGTSPSSTNMLSGTSIHTVTGASNSSFVTETSTTFTVSTSGTYYLGFRDQQTVMTSLSVLDDIVLTATQNLTFYNLIADGSTTSTKQPPCQQHQVDGYSNEYRHGGGNSCKQWRSPTDQDYHRWQWQYHDRIPHHQGFSWD